MKNHDKQVSPLSLDKNFFFIDSDSLDCVSTEFYGFAVIDGKLIQSTEEIEALFQQSALIPPPEYADFPKRASCGGFVYLKRDPDKITLIQDFMGSYGIYLYKDGDYFALSNSFLYLLDKVKKTHHISFNRAYADFLVVSSLCSVAYSETMVNEIQELDRSAVVEININKKELNISYIDYEENTVELNSPEGMAILDRWYKNWTSYISTLKSQNIRIDLSGGFDSRLTFLLAQGADIDLNKIYVKSINDGLHTHKEDFEIATAISRFYDVVLNKIENLHCKEIPQTTNDILNFSFYLKLTFHQQMYFRYDGCYVPKCHYFSGAGGECVRAYWKMSEKDYTETCVNRSRVFSAGNRARFERSIRSVLDLTFAGIKKKFSVFGRSINESDLALNLYRETRCRNHFGKSTVENYIGGSIYYCPLLDPLLHKLKLSDDNCPDRNLLIAVIFNRYNKKLLDFKFEGNRSIDPKTIKHAESINHAFPFVKAETTAQSAFVCKNEPQDCTVTPEEKFIASREEVSAQVKNIFYSARTKGTFLTQYDEEVYNWVSRDMQTKKYQPFEHAYAVIAVSTVLQAVYANEGLNNNAFAFFADFQNKNDCLSEIFSTSFNLDSYITARIDIKNKSLASSAGNCTNDLEFTEITDRRVKIKMPSWFSQGGKGYIIESQAGKLKIVFKCINAGNLSIALRGIDVRDKNGNDLPAWIDFTSLIVNDETIFHSVKSVWHKKPFLLTRAVKSGQIVSICAEWQPHDYISTGYTQAAVYNDLALRYKKLENDAQIQTKAYNDLALRYKKLENSKSLRIGRKITYFPRTLKKLLKHTIFKLKKHL